MNKKRVVIVVLQLLWLTIVCATAQDTTALRYSDYITAATIKKHLSVLASDSLEGRETAQPGMQKATRYVAGVFSETGLKPALQKSFYQPLPLINFSNGTFSVKANKHEFVYGKDYYFIDAPPDRKINSNEIVFAGYGIKDSASGWDDYGNTEIENKIILILEGEPTGPDGISVISKTGESSWKNNRNTKFNIARNKGAMAVFFVLNEFEKNYERFSKRLEHGRYLPDNTENNTAIPVILITREMAGMILKNKKIIPHYEKQSGVDKKSIPKFIRNDIELSSKLEKIACNNVIGLVEGSDLKDEVIVISAHLDHLGKKDGKIYYGADDDGSGSASILAMAEIFAKAAQEGKGPRRSLLFIAFSGEEKGLLGSGYYVNNPVFPLNQTIANLNIDMIGRVDTITRPTKNYTYIIGSDKLSTQLHSINETANDSCCDLALDYRYNDPSDKLKLYYRSDHYNFAKNNIPVIFYFTGIHEDYHKPTDTIDKIDFEKTAGIAKLIFTTAWELANRSERIVVDVVNDFK